MWKGRVVVVVVVVVVVERDHAVRLKLDYSEEGVHQLLVSAQHLFVGCEEEE